LAIPLEITGSRLAKSGRCSPILGGGDERWLLMITPALAF
jgi:hypothetical protein